MKMHYSGKKVVAEKKAAKSEAYKAVLQEECARLHIDNIDLALEAEEESAKDPDFDVLSICSKTGQRYPPEVRKLYYSLLTSQVPASKVEVIVKTVLKTFHPSLDVDQLQLPKKSCASYMRMLELKTIKNAHKATVLVNRQQKGRAFTLIQTEPQKHRKNSAESLSITWL